MTVNIAPQAVNVRLRFAYRVCEERGMDDRMKARATAAARAGVGDNSLGALPEWNLADLYPSMDGPELARDVDRAMGEAVTFEEAWKGKLADEAGKGADGRLGAAMVAYEALDELMGRIMSYAGLIYAGDTSDPK